MNFILQNISRVRKKVDFFSLFTIFAIINSATFTFSWLFHVDNLSQPKDWLLFWDTGNLIASGSFDKIYPGVTPNLPFIYPPYFLFLVYPLHYLSKPFGYIAIVAFSIMMLLLAFWVMSSIVKLSRPAFLKLCIIILSSASWIIMLPLGHFSSLYLFLICAGLKLCTSKMPWQAGGVLSLLMLKPNIGIIFPFLFLLRREFKLLTGWVVGIGTLCLLSIFVFKYTWWNYISASTTINSILAQIQPWKQHTLHAFLRSFLNSNSQGFVFWAWVASVSPLIGLCFYTWYTSKERNDHYPRLFGIATLAIIVCNPYLNHYDAIIAALPAALWFSNKNQYYFRFSHGLIGAFLFLAYLIQQVSVLYVQKGLSLVSVPLTFCLIVDCFDLISLNSSKQRDVVVEIA